MELGAAEGEGLDEDARQAFADLVARITAWFRTHCRKAPGAASSTADPAAAALHIITVTRGFAVLERAFGDEAQLRKIAAHTIDLVLQGRPLEATCSPFGQHCGQVSPSVRLSGSVEPFPAPRRQNPDHRVWNCRS